MAIHLDQHYQISNGGTDIVAVDCTPQLADAKTLTGTPTVAVQSGGTGLTVANVQLNTTTYTDTNQEPAATVAANHAVLFTVAPTVSGTWRLKITVNTTETAPAARTLVYTFDITAT